MQGAQRMNVTFETIHLVSAQNFSKNYYFLPRDT